MKIRFAVLFLVALPLYAADEMRRLDWLVGEWKGEASMRMGAATHAVAQSERVQSKLGGTVLLIEGLGRNATGEVVHDALAVASWDAAAKKYRFDAWTAKNGYVEAWMTVAEDGGVAWGFDTPQGKIRYRIARTDTGAWHEEGELSRDGNQWQKFFEMTLQKVK